jgi:hypothetical protein
VKIAGVTASDVASDPSAGFAGQEGRRYAEAVAGIHGSTGPCGLGHVSRRGRLLRRTSRWAASWKVPKMCESGFIQVHIATPVEEVLYAS